MLNDIFQQDQETSCCLPRRSEMVETVRVKFPGGEGSHRRTYDVSTILLSLRSLTGWVEPRTGRVGSSTRTYILSPVAFYVEIGALLD